MGLLQAVSLGLAAAAQQLSRRAGFLILSIFFVRRGDLSTPRAALVTARYAGVAVLAFLAANAPFIAADPRRGRGRFRPTLTQGRSSTDRAGRCP